MGNGLTTKLRIRGQWIVDSHLETHNTDVVVTIPTIAGLFLLASLIISVLELVRKVK